MPHRSVTICADGASKKERLSELSYVNVAFTIMVILVHIFSEAISTLNIQSLQYFVIYTPWKLFHFVTQGFVFISGVKLFLKNFDDVSIGKFYLTRVKRVIVPYILWVVIYYAYFVKIGWFEFSFTDLFKYIAHGDISAQFYFIIIICQMYLLSPIINKILNHCNGFFAILASLFISLILGNYLPQIVAIYKPEYYFSMNDRLFTTYIFYFIAGAVVGKNYAYFKEAIYKSRTYIVISAIFSAFVYLSLSYLTVSGRISLYWCDILNFAYCISAILLFMAASVYLSTHIKKIPHIVRALDKSSYMLYLSHVLILVIIRNVLNKLGIFDIGVRLVITLVATTVSVVISVALWGLCKKRFSCKKCI